MGLVAELCVLRAQDENRTHDLRITSVPLADERDSSIANYGQNVGAGTLQSAN
jgi:hypothetical protein